MNEAYQNAIQDHGATLVTHIGLFDDDTEITGGDPAYARQAVTWTTAANGLIRPDADLDFNIPADATVTAWHGFSDATGGTDYDGEALTPEGPYGAQGTFRLLAAQTAIDIDNL